MRLYLVQHAEAKKEEEDPERGLTARGLTDIRKVAEYAARLPVAVNAIYHSGKKRAAQTAQMLADFIRPKVPLFAVEGLSPQDDPGTWFSRLKASNEDMIIVGHLPHLAKLAGLLLEGDSERNCIAFKMGGMVCLKRGDNDRWTVEWVLVPEVVRG
ncbi:MAG TPA: phosphohistidine phosphatase SixA [Syntrophorhabdaceae bacterium]|nr:phosphohistidine phosphatase SixA [Syntrophorhabdaceae bacterium]